jgi:hypothetical protein
MIPIHASEAKAQSRNWERRAPDRYVRLTCAVGLLFVCATTDVSAQQNKRKAHSYIPPKGFVADSITAVRVAEAVLIPIWGDQDIAEQRPLAARLRNGVWIIRGNPPKGTVGGVVELEIAKRDGRILRTWFSK